MTNDRFTCPHCGIENKINLRYYGPGMNLIMCDCDDQGGCGEPVVIDVRYVVSRVTKLQEWRENHGQTES